MPRMVVAMDAIVLRPTAPELHSLALLTESSDAFVADVSQTSREGSKMPCADWKLMAELDAEQRRAAEGGLSEDELVLGKAERERVKLASKNLLKSVTKLTAPLERWTEKEQNKALVEAEILDHLFQVLPSPPFTDEEKQAVAKKV